MANRPAKKTNPGDLTGRIGAQQEAEAADQIAEREKELTMARAAEVRKNESGVFDPKSGEIVEVPEEVEDLSGPMGFGGPSIDDGNLAVEVDEEFGDTDDYEPTVIGGDEIIEVPQQIVRPTPGQPVADDGRMTYEEFVAMQERGGAPAPVVDHGVQTVEDDMVVARVNADIDQMTFGVGNNYTFEAGKKYRMPRLLAKHLDRLGLIWH